MSAPTAAGRHAAIYCQAAGRATLVALTRVESPRQAFRTARRRTAESFSVLTICSNWSTAPIAENVLTVPSDAVALAAFSG
jgi:hypothetical protein